MFVCTLDNETEIVALFGNGEHIYRAAIGYDTITNHVFSVLVVFAPIAGYSHEEKCELVFRVVEADAEGVDVHEYSDGLPTKNFITERDDRDSVRDLIQHLIANHIDAVRPPAVEMMTHTEGLPKAALRKFHEIAAVFRDKGYTAGLADPWHGRWIWMMRLE